MPTSSLTKHHYKVDRELTAANPHHIHFYCVCGSETQIWRATWRLVVGKGVSMGWVDDGFHRADAGLPDPTSVLLDLDRVDLAEINSLTLSQMTEEFKNVIRGLVVYQRRYGLMLTEASVDERGYLHLAWEPDVRR